MVVSYVHSRVGKSVALYFADYSKLKCRNFLPLLTSMYRSINESGMLTAFSSVTMKFFFCYSIFMLGDQQKIEIIFVSLDESFEEYEKHRNKQPWLAISYGNHS